MINFIKDFFSIFNSVFSQGESFVIMLCSIVPALSLITYILYSDRQSKEPPNNVLICLLSGFLTIGISLFLQNQVSNSGLLFLSDFLAPLIEEFSKIGIFILFIFDNKDYDDIFDAIVYMSLIALSFAFFENIAYSLNEISFETGVSLAIIRDFVTIPLHIVCGVVSGYFLALGTFSKKQTMKFLNIILALLVSTAIHFAFNTSITLINDIQNNTLSSFFILLLVATLISLMIAVIKENIKLNKAFMKNNISQKLYSYVMNKKEFENSTTKLNKIKRHKLLTKKINIKKKKNKI